MKYLKQGIVIGIIMTMMVAGASILFAGGATESPQESQGIDMVFWIFLNPESTEDPRSIVLKEIVDEYNANNSYGNTVTVESIHWSRFEAQAIQAAAAKSGPDIINMYSDQLKQHIAGGTVQPMTSFAEDFLATMPDYVYSADTLKINGNIYSLPWESRTFVHWYRSDMFDGAPASLDDLANRAGKASDANMMGFVIGLSDGSNAASFMESFIPLIRSAGGDLFDSDGNAIFNSEAGVQVLEYLKSLVAKNAMSNASLSLVVDDIIDGFKAGTIYSMNAGTQRAAAIRQSSLNAQIKSAPIPGFEVGTPAPALVAGQTLGIGKYAKDPAMAFDFIKYFYSVENQTKWLKANVLPARADVYNDSDIKQLPNYNELKMWNEYAATGSVAFYPADYTEMAVRLAKAAQEVVFRNTSAKQALDEVANWYNNK
jgi:ABC-type glycerol-3-phosphate transport system substrate-binding protein